MKSEIYLLATCVQSSWSEQFKLTSDLNLIAFMFNIKYVMHVRTYVTYAYTIIDDERSGSMDGVLSINHQED